MAGESQTSEDHTDSTDSVPDRGLIDMLSGLGRSAEETLRSLSDGVGGAEDVVRDGLEQAEETIRKYPLLAVGVAAGLGFVLGLMLRGGGGSEADDTAGSGPDGEADPRSEPGHQAGAGGSADAGNEDAV